MADPDAPSGGRDLFYLYNTYADKLRFVVDSDFRLDVDNLYFAVKLVDPAATPVTTQAGEVTVATLVAEDEQPDIALPCESAELHEVVEPSE